MTSNLEPFHQRLRRIREERGLTAKAMADLIGVPASTYRDWENGRGLRLPPLLQMSQVLAISVTELVGGKREASLALYQELVEIEEQLKQYRLRLASFF